MTPSRLAYGSLTVLTLGLWLAMSLWSLPLIASEADGLTAFDLRPFGYDRAQAEAFLNALSDEGRAFYTGVQHRLDTVFPALLAVWLTLSLWGLLAQWPVWARVGLGGLAAAGMAFDFVENARVSEMLAVSQLTDPMVRAASQATVLKSACVTPLMLVLVWALMRKLWTRVSG